MNRNSQHPRKSWKKSMGILGTLKLISFDSTSSNALLLIFWWVSTIGGNDSENHAFVLVANNNKQQINNPIESIFIFFMASPFR